MPLDFGKGDGVLLYEINYMAVDGLKILLKGGCVPCGEGYEQKDILLNDGVIADIAPDLPDDSGGLVFFLSGCHLLPGLCDIHVHFREPGFSEKETVHTGTQAAARGGFTLVCPMPNVEPPPDNLEHLAVQQALIEQQAVVPVLPFASITVGRRGERVVDMAALAPYVAGFSDDGSGVQGDAVMRQAFMAAKACGAVVAAHSEDARYHTSGWVHDGQAARRNGWPGIPAASEYKQIERDLALVAETGARYHVCHVSAKESVELIRRAKAQGLPVTCETAPHYIALCDEDIQDDGRFKMAPPIRTAQDRAALIEGLVDGTVDAIATDHAPHTAAEKGGGLKDSLNGVVGLETSFAVSYTYLVKTGRMTLAQLVQRMATTPRRIVGRPQNPIEVGARLDAVAVRLEDAWTVDPQQFATKGRSTPFAGMQVYGRPVMTWADGALVYNGMED